MKNQRIIAVWALFFHHFILVSCHLVGQSPIQKEIKAQLQYLASFELQGRYPGTKGDSLAANFIAQKFREHGIKPLFGSYFQPFEYITGTEIDDDNLFILSGDTLDLFTSFLPLSISAETHLKASTVIHPADSLHLLPPKMKPNHWLVLLLTTQDPSQRELLTYTTKAELLDAAGLILITEFDSLKKISPNGRKQMARGNFRANIPVVMVDRSVWDEKYSKSKNIFVEALISVKPIWVKTQNVAGIIPGTAFPQSYIIVGAHYDHLGFGGKNSGSRQPELSQIHPGADDNASGTVTVIQLAKQFRRQQPRHSIIFVAFGAEEQGLIGSRKFLEELPIPIDSIKVMLNFDMVGRMENKTLYVGGVGTANLFSELLQKQKSEITIVTSNSGSGPSDHASFYNAKIPVLYFNTGIHTDYHTTGDIPEKINYEGMEAIFQYSEQIIKSLIENSSLITFTPTSEPVQHGNQANLKITLGIMPDVAGGDNNGLKVLGVNPGGIAAKLTIEKGDVITNINGIHIKNIYDYMSALQTLDREQVIHITILRNGIEKVFLTQL